MSTSATEVVVHRSPELLARTVASRLVTHLAGLQSRGKVPSIVLTGGSIADQVHRAVLHDEGIDAVDWSKVEVWFGDERFVREDDPERNARQAREALLDHLPLDPERVHVMPPLGGRFGDDVDTAAQAYARELDRVLGGSPSFDVLMLGIGPDGHCASLFPGRPEVTAHGTVLAVRDSPKPPATRISMSMELLKRADQVWFLATGAEKASAVRQAVAGVDVNRIPAAGPKGRTRTVWILDSEAANELRPHA